MCRLKFNLKNFYYSNLHTCLYILIVILIISSCTKVVDINLNEASPKYVIEGNITNQPGNCQIIITQTIGFNQTNNFPGISGAIVTISDDNGIPIKLTDTGNGIYKTTVINGTSGHTYTLQVTIGNKIFTSQSKMPQQVFFDTVYIQDFIGFGNATKFANVVLLDPPGKGNTYRFIQYKNNIKNNAIFIINDEYSDGKPNTILLAAFNSTDQQELKSKDKVLVEMHCIDPILYNYWFSLDQNSSGGNSIATPGNAISNITGGALGYFSAHTVQTKSVVVP